MAEQTLFTKIINHEISADIRYQDEDVTVFADINPRAKVHLLVVPTKAIASINDLTNDDALLVGKLVLTAKKMAEDLGIAAMPGSPRSRSRRLPGPHPRPTSGKSFRNPR